MVRKTGGITGSNFYKDPKAAGDKHAKESASKAKANSKFFRNFWRTKTKAYMTTSEDDQHLSVMLNCLNTLEAGDPQTAFNLMLDSWKIGAKTGNMKEVDTTELANFKTWVAQWAIIAWDIMSQACLRPFQAAVTESSVTATSSTALAIWNQADWDAFLTSLEKLNCPDFIYRFLKPWLYYIRMTDSFMKAELPIPPSYLLLHCHRHTLAQLQAHRESAKAVMGTAETHCQKYGIPFSKFNLGKLACVEVARADVYKNQDLVALLNIIPFSFSWKTGPGDIVDRFHSACLTGANLTTDFTVIEYVFDDSQEMSMTVALYPLWGTVYHATNNPYGEIFTHFEPGGTELKTNILRMKLLGTSWTAGTIVSCRFACELLSAYWTSDADYALGYTGAEITTDQLHGTVAWPAYLENMKMCKDVGHVAGEEALDSAFNAVKFMIYGG